MLPVLSRPTPALSAMEAIRDKTFMHAGDCLMDACHRVHGKDDQLFTASVSQLDSLTPAQLGISPKLWLEEEQPFAYAPVVQHLQAVPCFPSPQQVCACGLHRTPTRPRHQTDATRTRAHAPTQGCSRVPGERPPPGCWARMLNGNHAALGTARACRLSPSRARRSSSASTTP